MQVKLCVVRDDRRGPDGPRRSSRSGAKLIVVVLMGLVVLLSHHVMIVMVLMGRVVLLVHNV